MKKSSKASRHFAGVSAPSWSPFDQLSSLRSMASSTWAISLPLVSTSTFSSTPLEIVEQSLVYKIKEGHLAEEVVVGAYNLVLDLKEGLPAAAFDSIKGLATRHIKEGTFEEGVEELKGLLVVIRANCK